MLPWGEPHELSFVRTPSVRLHLLAREFTSSHLFASSEEPSRVQGPEMSDFIWEFYQHGKIISAASDASHALSKATTSQAGVHDVERKLDRLALLNQAIWSLVKQQTALRETDLMEEIKRLDMLDGRADGKLAETRRCGKCGTVLTASAISCYICGAPSGPGSAFHGI